MKLLLFHTDKCFGRDSRKWTSLAILESLWILTIKWNWVGKISLWQGKKESCITAEELNDSDDSHCWVTECLYAYGNFNDSSNIHHFPMWILQEYFFLRSNALVTWITLISLLTFLSINQWSVLRICVCVCVHRVSIKIICNHNENRNTFPSLYQMNSVSCAIVPEWKGVRRGQIFGSFWTPDCTHIEKDYFLIQINVCTYAIFLLIIMISYFVTIVRTWCESRFSVPLVHTHTYTQIQNKSSFSIWHFMWMETNHILMISWWHLNSFQCAVLSMFLPIPYSAIIPKFQWHMPYSHCCLHWLFHSKYNQPNGI